jgi:DNA-directed RNA polymerase subunit M/transcription elongation factor TFIIS
MPEDVICQKCQCSSKAFKLPITTNSDNGEISVYACPKCGNVFCVNVKDNKK